MIRLFEGVSTWSLSNKSCNGITVIGGFILHGVQLGVDVEVKPCELMVSSCSK